MCPQMLDLKSATSLLQSQYASTPTGTSMKQIWKNSKQKDLPSGKQT